jgi:hypothetical protein
MKFRYEESAERWLEDNGFSEPERARLLELLNKLEKDMVENKKGPLVVLPKDTPDKLAAMVTLLDAVDDDRGCPACFTSEKTIIIPSEARALYSEGMELQELERTLKLADKAKVGRGQMDPRRRGSSKS